MCAIAAVPLIGMGLGAIGTGLQAQHGPVVDGGSLSRGCGHGAQSSAQGSPSKGSCREVRRGVTGSRSRSS